MTKPKIPELKPLLEQRLKTLLPDTSDFQSFLKIIHTSSPNWIRCNTLKIQPNVLFARLSKKWQVQQLFPSNPEIILVPRLSPGELGKSIEHMLGYFYIQDLASMLPPLALQPTENDLVLDLTAAPGSKTTQIAALMQNKGTLIANELKMNRLKILSANLEKAGVTNTIITRKDAIAFCSRIAKETDIRFDKILLDAPCSGEGTLRTDTKTFYMWNPKMIKKFSRIQKKLLATALTVLKPQGTLIYSTCTHAPEEDEEIIDFALNNFPVKVESISCANNKGVVEGTNSGREGGSLSTTRKVASSTTLPIKCRKGITKWKNKTFHKDVEKACRIYPHDNNTEGFFLAKLILLEEVKPR